MRVLHLSTSDTGGAGKACIRLHRELLRKNINSKVLVLDKNKPEGKEIYPYFSGKSKYEKAFALLKRHLKPAINSRKLSGKVSSYEIFSFPDSFIDITNHHLYKEADIIHIHFISEFLDYKSFFQRNEKPVVWTLHDMYPFTGGCHYSAECIKYQTECISCPQLQGTKDKNISLKYQKIKKTAVNKTEKMIVVAPSDWIKNTAKSSDVFKNKSHLKIHHGLDLNLYKPRDNQLTRELLSIPSDKNVILYIAEDFSRENKGFDALINSLKCVEYDFLLCTVGKGKNLKLDNFEHKHLGFITDELLLSQIYSAADITIIPSIYESFSLTTLESLACGTPVVAFNNTGPGEIIRHMQTGYTAEVGNINEIADGINHLLSDKVILKNFSHQARMDVEKRFDAGNRTSDYIDVYNSLHN